MDEQQRFRIVIIYDYDKNKNIVKIHYCYICPECGKQVKNKDKVELMGLCCPHCFTLIDLTGTILGNAKDIQLNILSKAA